MPSKDPKKKKSEEDEFEDKAADTEEGGTDDELDDMAEDDEDGPVDWTAEEKEY